MGSSAETPQSGVYMQGSLQGTVIDLNGMTLLPWHTATVDSLLLQLTRLLSRMPADISALDGSKVRSIYIPLRAVPPVYK